MTQYNDKVERQRLLLEAEEWATGIRDIHMHSITSMWYETNPEDMDDGGVLDVHYNDGRIERSKDGKIIRVMGERLTGQKLIDKFEQLA